MLMFSEHILRREVCMDCVMWTMIFVFCILLLFLSPFGGFNIVYGGWDLKWPTDADEILYFELLRQRDFRGIDTNLMSGKLARFCFI